MSDFEKPTIYESHESGAQTNNVVPWADEPTPTCDGVYFIAFRGPRPYDNEVVGVDVEVSRNLERRLRAAERLLEDALLTYHNGMTTLQDHTADQIRAHLEAARKEDER